MNAKGQTVQVNERDAAGFPTDSVERDVDGKLWHIREGEDPVQITDDEARAVAAEAENTRPRRRGRKSADEGDTE